MALHRLPVGYNDARCFVAPGGFERSEKPMDTQTIIAVCALFTVVIGIVSLARRE